MPKYWVYLAVGLCGWLLPACREQAEEGYPAENHYAARQYDLQLVGKVRIPIDTLTSNDLSLFQYKELAGKHYYIVHNHMIDKLEVYDLDAGRLFTRIPLYSEGANAVPVINGYYLHNWDSIFLFSDWGSQIYLIDSACRVKDKYQIDEYLPGDGTRIETLIDLDGYFVPSFTGGVLSFWAMPLIPFEKKAYYQYPLGIDYDIRQRQVVHYFGYYPASYRGDEIYGLDNNLDRILTPEYDIHTFGASHYLFLYSRPDKQLVKAVYARSKYLPAHFEPLLTAGEDWPDLQQQKNYSTTHGYYGGLIYDSANRLYYRFVKHAQPLKDANGYLNDQLNSKISVMILDKDFAIAGEVMLPARRYLYFISFVSEGRLYINTCHRDNPEYEEDYLQFAIFKPVLQ